MKKGTKVTLFAAAVTGAALAGARLARLVRLQNEELNDMIGQQPGYTPAPMEEPVQQAPEAEQPEQEEQQEPQEEQEEQEEQESPAQDEEELKVPEPDPEDDWEEDWDDDSAIDPDEPL